MRRMVDDKEMISIDDRITALEQGGGGGGDSYTKAETDALLLTKVNASKHFDDDDNPEDFYIKQPQTYSSGIELHASRDDNHHPDYANVLITPTHVVMLANSANHGDNDDDYTGSIEVTDGHVDLDVTDGTNTTTLRVSPNGVTINGSPIGGGKQLYAHSIVIVGSISGGNNFGGLAYFISDDGTAITANNIVAKLTAAGYDTASKRVMFSGGVYLSGATVETGMLNGLGVTSGSSTSLRVAYTSINNGFATNSSFAIDLTSADVSFSALDTVITL